MMGTLLSGRYEILEIIGTGGMANVYKARCTYLNRYVAIKVLKDEFKNDEDFLKRFNIESQAAAGLSHTNIVSVYDIGSENDIHYIVMEYVEGITLKEYLAENGALSWEKAVDFATQIASALQHAHRKGIVHRDIKPQNILVTKDNVLKVTDFGIARAVSTFTMKVEDSAMCTVHYCSPEQARGGYTDEKSDIYSLGIVMYEMLTGKLPFESDNSVSVALKHMQEEAIAPSEIVADIPSGVEEIVKKAMEKNQNDRFQSAGEMLIELNWVKQMEGDKAEKREHEEMFKTKKIDVGAVEEGMKKTAKTNKIAKKTNKTAQQQKEDKVAVLAGIGASVLVVAILAFIVIAIMFPGAMPWSGGAKGEIEVPDLVGVDFEKAKSTYENFNFKEDDSEYSADYDEGLIISQDPEEGTMIKSPYTITVVVSKGAKTVKMPDVINMDYRQAQIKLDEQDILYSVEYKTDSTIPENIVIETDPGKGAKIKAGVDIVNLVVSSGEEEPLPVVPALIGKSEDEAKRELSSVNLNSKSVYEKSKMSEKGQVIRQSIASGTQVTEKTTVTITIGTGDEDTTGSGNTGEGQTGGNTVTKEVTVMLPADKEQVTVKVTANGKTVYQGMHKTSEGAISVPVSGSGNVVVVAYIDDQKVTEKTIKF
ncbi:MAG: Stk1 family PASTA domain-containing Ser/Thr kinase [Clostridia bacterium]|nr:Stk1 family PASTA domain-containing Ser/Thr kinase [Clostridia bacterium]